MTSYSFPRLAIDHARYWRGVPHIWSTTYFLSGTDPTGGEWATLAGQLVGMENEILATAPSDQGGFLEARGYNTGGGAPVYTDTYGVIETPSTWEAYAGTAWSSEGSEIYENAAEVALLLKIPLAGLSSSGKPVFGRKFYHSVIAGGSAGGTAADVAAGVVTAIQTATAILNNGALSSGRRVISNAGRLPSANPICEAYFSNHQMPRGRKRAGTSSSSLSSLLAEAARLRTLIATAGAAVSDL